MECGRRLALQTLSFLPPSLGGELAAVHTASKQDRDDDLGPKHKHAVNTSDDSHPSSTVLDGGGDGDGGSSGVSAVAGPTVLSAVYDEHENAIVLTIANGTGAGR